MSTVEDLLANNARYAATFAPHPTAAPALGAAVVACMDARMDVAALLGLRPGDAHVIRNAGGVVTDDVIRSLTISQRLLGTREIVLVHHTGCGMLTFTDEAFRQQLEAEVGVRPAWEPGSFADLAADVRRSVARIVDCPFLVDTSSVRGFVFDVDTGLLDEVAP